jgi:hypothetical protein
VEDLSRLHGVVCSPGWHYMGAYARDKEQNRKYMPWDAFVIAKRTDRTYSSRNLMISSAPRTLVKHQRRRRSSSWMRMQTFLLLAVITKWIRRRLDMPMSGSCTHLIQVLVSLLRFEDLNCRCYKACDASEGIWPQGGILKISPVPRYH